MNPAAVLALIGDLYAQLTAAQQRAEQAEQRVAELEAERSAPGTVTNDPGGTPV